jgi:hypothetical protein
MGIRSEDGLVSFAIGLVLFFILPFGATFLVSSIVVQTVLKLANGVGDWGRAFTIGAWIGVAVGGWYTTAEAVDYVKEFWPQILRGMLMLLGSLLAFLFFGWLFD